MSNGSLTRDGAENADSSDPSVFDFLYSDAQRIGSLLAQFEPGLLLGRVQEDEGERGKVERAHRAGSVDLQLIGAEKGTEVESGVRKTVRIAKSFDPYWANARALLDYLSEHDLIKTGIPYARLGEIVLCKGRAWILDSTDVHQLYGKEGFRSAAQNNLALRAPQIPNFSWDQVDIDYEVVANMAGQVQFQIRDGFIYDVWATLRPEGLVTPATELAAKHGPILEGEWQLLGVKDANPDSEDQKAKLARVEALNKAIEGRPYMADAIALSWAAKNMFGRPAGSYGVTPLLIFRKIG